MYIRRKVKSGTATGRTIGFPTLNFNVGQFGDNYSEGVYKCEVKIEKKLYNGALFFGLRSDNQTKILEVYVIGFSKMIYGQLVGFRVIKKIREPKSFGDLESLKKQIEIDISSI